MIAAVVLAAGESRRMGSPKLLLPWHGRTLLEAVVGNLRDGGVERILVVVGADREGVERALAGAEVELVPNPSFARGEMLSSIQAGLRALKRPTAAALLTPGDLPTIRPETIGALLRAWPTAPGKIWAPEFGGRRGHPVLLPKAYWPDLLALGEGESLRTFLRRHDTEIARLAVQDPGIHADLDTPADYQRAVKRSD